MQQALHLNSHSVFPSILNMIRGYRICVAYNKSHHEAAAEGTKGTACLDKDRGFVFDQSLDPA